MGNSTLQKGFRILVVLLALLWMALPALAQDPTNAPIPTTPVETLTPDESTPAPTAEPVETPELPSGLMIILSGMFRDAIGQGFAMIRDLGLITFGGIFIVFCIFIVVFVRYIAPLIPKSALEILREAGKDGLAVAKVELDRRHEEAKKTETPLDDTVIESLKALHSGILAILNMTSALAQNLAPAGQAPQSVAAGLTPQEQLDRDAFIALNKPAPVINIYTSTGGDPETLKAEIAAAVQGADVSRGEAQSVPPAQPSGALEMTEVDDLDFDDARG